MYVRMYVSIHRTYPSLCMYILISGVKASLFTTIERYSNLSSAYVLGVQLHTYLWRASTYVCTPIYRTYVRDGME